jgi:hypothetical protein
VTSGHIFGGLGRKHLPGVGNTDFAISKRLLRINLHQ